jgi:hypothetical protein
MYLDRFEKHGKERERERERETKILIESQKRTLNRFVKILVTSTKLLSMVTSTAA